MRHLERRVQALSHGIQADRVVEALQIIADGGAVPPGLHGARAAEVWRTTEDEDPEFRWLACYLKATGKTVAQVILEESDEHQDPPPLS